MTRWRPLTNHVVRIQSRLRQLRRDQSSTASHDPTLSPLLLRRARILAAEHTQLSQQLALQYDPILAKKAGSLSVVADAVRKWEAASESLPELEELIKDSSADHELKSIATEELATVSEDLASLSQDLKSSLVPRHPFASLPCLIELRPGAGGDEAALFAGNLLRMYQAFCKRRGLRVNILKLDHMPSIGSEDQIQEAVLEVESAESYNIFRSEAGVHRVQRVPATESKGRTHTSAVSVLVLPQFPSRGDEEHGDDNFDDPSSDYYVDAKDVRTDVMRARGAGGQHVNTTDSAVRLTHVPTGTVVAIQDSRSQPQNRQKAWQILRGKLAQARREAREEEMARLRISVVGVSKMGRGDKIRTYNWSQQRVTDHRSGMTLHQLDDTLAGGESLDKIMASVNEWLHSKDFEALIADEEAADQKERTRKS